jgi:polyhydroxyalkanoate synthase subunit PhaC
MTQLLCYDTTFVLGGSGHIAGVINPASKNKRNHWVAAAAGPDPDRWLETAREVPGSWWPEWSTWFREQAGAEVPAPKTVAIPSTRASRPRPDAT